MATAQERAGGGAGRREPVHWLRLVIIWAVLSLAADLVIWFVWYPHLPPGRMSDVAQGQQFDIAVLGLCAAPVILFIWIYGLYAVIVWRHRAGDDEDGPPIHGSTRISVAWIVITSALVLGLFGFGTYQLIVPNGAGGGQGASPIWKPNTVDLQVQVIGQQWVFTYRYPQFGGFETTQLVLPEHAQVQFNVTSLDVIHSFWAYQLGVKADANPGVNNVAFAKPQQLGTFVVRCNELCGLWHGAMFDYGRVVTPAQFMAWARATRIRLASVTRLLPPYATTYDPTTIKNLGPVLTKLGLTGAGGGYYASPPDPAAP
ncbi:MAG TPA: cytochrome c oxidase subunit II [Streptosporangiaceae bacterium]|nr:cytochrome c oxidase subunit II [Streptosporangiaceae bacterium]